VPERYRAPQKGDTPLHLAAAKGHKVSVGKLLEDKQRKGKLGKKKDQGKGAATGEKNQVKGVREGEGGG